MPRLSLNNPYLVDIDLHALSRNLDGTHVTVTLSLEVCGDKQLVFFAQFPKGFQELVLLVLSPFDGLPYDLLR